MAEQSREPEILKSIIDDTEYNKTPQSRNEEILLSILNDTEYTKTPQSREEELLLELKDKIGHDITVEPLSVIENGTYTAPAGTAYSPVEVTITPPQLVKRVTGNPVEFSDGADAPLVRCVTEVQGSQDLHGYDKPWVGGAGKNKFVYPYYYSEPKTVNGVTFTVNDDGTILANGTATSQVVYTLHTQMSLTDGTYILTGGKNGAIYIGFGYYNSDEATSETRANDVGSGVTFTSHKGKITYVQLVIEPGYTVTNMTFYPMIRLSTVTDSTYAPYSNICPITAYTEGKIVETGKNLYNSADASIGYIDSAGEFVSQSGFVASDYIYIVSGNTYTLSYDRISTGGNRVGMRIAWYDDTHTFIRRDGTDNEGTELGLKTITATAPSNAKYARFSVVNDYNGSQISNNVQFEAGSSVTTYESYVGTTHTTTYPSAIYRGSEDVVNGEVVTEWAYKSLSIDASAGTVLTNYRRIRLSSINDYSIVARESAISDCLPYIYDFTGDYLHFYLRENGAGVYIFLPNDNTAYTVNICYPLATPLEIPVAPTNLPIKTLSGYNHIDSSTGETVLDYITDAYQNFVDTVNRAVPSTRKSGSGAMEVFMSLEQYKE